MDLVQQENNMGITGNDALNKLIKDFNKMLDESSSDKEFDNMREEEFKEEAKKEHTDKCEEINECTEDVVEDHEVDTNGIELTDDVYVVNDNYFLLANKVNNLNIIGNTELVFAHLNEERHVPGITEEQILAVLLYKNRNNKRRYDLIRQLLFN